MPLRSVTGQNIATLAAAGMVRRDLTPHELRNSADVSPIFELEVRHRGHTAAAYYARLSKKTIHRVGQFDLRVPKGAEFPPNVRVAIEFLARRAGWTVLRYETETHRHARITWLSWGRYARALGDG